MPAHKPKEANTAKDVTSFLEKIVINAGVGRLSQQANFAEKGLEEVSRNLALISGQKPHLRPAKKSIAGFKVREGQMIGLKVTLRRRKMVDFFERLIKIVLPRVRDFNGINLRSIDDGGALSIGFKEQFVFPEINPEESHLTFSLGVSLVPKVKDRAAAVESYRRLGVPIKGSVRKSEPKGE